VPLSIRNKGKGDILNTTLSAIIYKNKGKGDNLITILIAIIYEKGELLAWRFFFN